MRLSHALNDGQIFSWESPPPTLHPGEDYGCRCRAEPVPEYITITATNISDKKPEWNVSDWVNHYYEGGAAGRSQFVRRDV